MRCKRFAKQRPIYIGVSGVTIEGKFVSISGIEPSSSLINSVGKIDDFVIPPNPGTNRFFPFKPQYAEKAQDTEAKIIEDIMNDIAKAKGIKFKNTDLKEDFVAQVLSGSNLKINMTFEMNSCKSCAGIIETFELTNPNKINFKHGVFYE